MTCPVPSIPHLATLKTLSSTHALPIYVVGGALRDVLLQRPCHDIDLITPGDPTPLAKSFSQQHAGHWFWLDRQRLYSRVILKQDHITLQYDFAPFRAETLLDDLALRDFTINAMACHVDDLQAWIDPLGGKNDLQQHVLRECCPHSFADDPLRMLKGLRHCAQFDLTIEQATWQHCQATAPQLAHIAGERIRQELAVLFAQAAAQPAVLLFHQSGLAQAAGFPDLNREPSFPNMGRGHCSPQLEHAHDRDFCDGFTLNALAKFCFYLSQLPVDDYKLHQLLSALKISRKGVRLITFFHRFVRADTTILQQQQTSDRVRLLWLENLQAPLPEALLVLEVVERRAAMQLGWQRLYASCAQHLVNGRVRPLIDGKRFKELCPNLSGKALGNVLKKLRQAEIKGQVTSPQQAENYLVQWHESH